MVGVRVSGVVGVRSSVGHLQLLILDATGTKEIYELILGRQVDTLELNLISPVDVLQLGAGAYWRSSLLRPNSHTRRTIQDLVKTIVDSYPDRRIGIITFKNFIEPINEVIRDHRPPVSYAAFWAMRGSNSLMDCEILIVVGTPMANIGDLRAWASAIYWDGPAIDFTTVEFWERLGSAIDDPDLDVEANIPRSFDPRLRLLAWQLCDAELLQAIGRLRPLDHAEKKRLILLSNLPIPGFNDVKVFRTSAQMRSWFDGRGKAAEPSSKIARIKAAIRKARLQGDPEPTIRELMDKFGVSETLVKRARRQCRQ